MTSVPDRTSEFSIRRLLAVSEADVQGLARVLMDCVEGGASVSFMSPLTEPKARAFWHKIAKGVARGERALLIAESAGSLVGTVQLVLDQPENQPHRADLSKMLVTPMARRLGIGAALLRAAEDLGRAYHRSLLVLDTASPDAERLYSRAGWERCGVIPGFALWPNGGLCDTTFFYRRLEPLSASIA